MFRMHLNQHKKIHLNDVQCLELSSSEEGSRSLRMPMEFGKLHAPRHLQPRERLKRRISNQDVQSYEYQPATSGSAASLIHSSSSDECQVSQMVMKNLPDFESVNNSGSAKIDNESLQASYLSTSNGEGFEQVSQMSARNERFQPSFRLSERIDEGFKLASHLSERIDEGFRLASHLSARIDEGFNLASHLSVKNEGFQPASHLVPKAVSRFPSGNICLLGGDFISARQYMNPMHHRNDGRIKDEPSKNVWKRHNSSPETLRNSRTSHSLTQGLPLVHKKSRIKECQKNKLDRYFKCTPVVSSPPSDKAFPLLEFREPTDFKSERGSVSVESTREQNLVDDETVSQNSPTKSVLWSSIQKVPGSDTMYYSPNTSQYKKLLDGEKADCGSVRKSLWKSEHDFEEPVAKETHQWPSSRKKFKFEKKLMTASNISTGTNKLPNSGEETFPQQKLDDIPGNKYGLLGCSESELIELGSDTDFEDEMAAEKVNYFLYLPKEIVENILCRLPFMDLHLNVNRVCTAWNDVISSPKVSFFIYIYNFSYWVG